MLRTPETSNAAAKTSRQGGGAHRDGIQLSSHPREEDSTAGDGKGENRQRHPFPDAGHVADVVGVGLDVYRAGTEEQCQFHECVCRDVEQAARQCLSVEQSQPEHDIGELANRRIRQPPRRCPSERDETPVRRVKARIAASGRPTPSRSIVPVPDTSRTRRCQTRRFDDRDGV